MTHRHVELLLVATGSDAAAPLDDLFIELLVESEGTHYGVTRLHSDDSMLRALRSGAHDLVLLEDGIGDRSAIDVLGAIRDAGLDVPCIVLSERRDRALDVAAMQAGAADFLVTSELTSVELERRVRYAIERADTVRTLRESEARFRAVVEAATDAIVLADDDGHLLTWNRATLDLFGLDEGRTGAERLTDLVVSRNDEPLTLAELHEHHDLRGRRSDGSTFPLALSLSSWEGVDGRLWSAIIRDVTTQRDLEDRLVHQAFHDPLTSLANRALFTNRVDHSLVRLRRRNGAVGVLFLDLDDFKRINDSFGHAMGDTVLVSVAERILGCVRSNDTVARLGGDEFAVLVEDSDDPRVSAVVAERIMRAMAPTFSVAGREIEVSCSIGVAVAMSDHGSGADLLRDADVAMYAAKGHGKNRIELFEDRMHTAIMERVSLEGDLRLAVLRNEIVAHFQPIFDLATGKLTGFEALARWQHPERGLLAPADFISVAESNGLIVPIGRAVLEQAVEQVRDWQLRHPEAGKLSVSVNLSARQLDEPDVVEMIGAALDRVGLDPSCLVLEVTESLVVRRSAAAGERLNKIVELGVGLAVDDFGTGYSALSYLHDLPLTVLKVDRSFVNRIHDERSRALLEAIMSMSRRLGLSTVAEGIETEEQLHSLTDFGCALGQGFLFARPLTPDAAGALLSNVNNADAMVVTDGVVGAERVIGVGAAANAAGAITSASAG